MPKKFEEKFKTVKQIGREPVCNKNISILKKAHEFLKKIINSDPLKLQQEAQAALEQYF